MLEFRFDGDNSNPNTRPINYIWIPVEPGVPVDWTTPDGQYVLSIGDIPPTGNPGPGGHFEQGASFWGWFDNLTARASDGRVRPADLRATGWDLEATNFTFTEAQFNTLGNGTVISFTAIYSLWGDANDDDIVDSEDIQLISQYIFDRPLPVPFFNNPINLRAANVTVSGRVDSYDIQRLSQYLFDRPLRPNVFFGAVLGRP
jgi:hypothetical protein